MTSLYCEDYVKNEFTIMETCRVNLLSELFHNLETVFNHNNTYINSALIETKKVSKIAGKEYTKSLSMGSIFINLQEQIKHLKYKLKSLDRMGCLSLDDNNKRQDHDKCILNCIMDVNCKLDEFLSRETQAGPTSFDNELENIDCLLNQEKELFETKSSTFDFKNYFELLKNKMEIIIKFVHSEINILSNDNKRSVDKINVLNEQVKELENQNEYLKEDSKNLAKQCHEINEDCHKSLKDIISKFQIEAGTNQSMSEMISVIQCFIESIVDRTGLSTIDSSDKDYLTEPSKMDYSSISIQNSISDNKEPSININLLNGSVSNDIEKDNQINELKIEIEILKDQRNKDALTVEFLKQELDKFTISEKESNQYIESLKLEYLNVQQKLKELTEINDTNLTEIANNNTKFDDLIENCKPMTTEIEITKLCSEILDQSIMNQSEKENNEDELNKLNLKIIELQEEIEKSSTKLKLNEEEINKLNLNINEYHIEMEKLLAKVEKDKENKEQEIQDLTNKLIYSGKRYDDLYSENIDIKNELKNFELLLDENAEKISELKSEKENLEKEIDIRRKELESSIEDCVKIYEELEDTKVLLENREETIKEMGKSLEDKGKEIIAITSDFQEKLTEYQMMQDELQNRNEDLEKELSHVSNAVQELTAELEKYQSENSEIRGSYLELENKVTVKEREIEIINIKLVDYESKNNDLLTEKNSLNEQLSSIIREKEESISEISKMKIENENLGKEIDILRKELESSIEDCVKIYEEVEEAKVLLENREETIKEMGKSLEDKGKEIISITSDFQEKLTEYQTTQDELKNINGDLEKKLADVNYAVQELTAELEKYQVENSEIRVSKAELENKVIEKEKEIEITNIKLVDYENKHTDLVNEKNSIIEQLSSKIREMEESISRLLEDQKQLEKVLKEKEIYIKEILQKSVGINCELETTKNKLLFAEENWSKYQTNSESLQHELASMTLELEKIKAKMEDESNKIQSTEKEIECYHELIKEKDNKYNQSLKDLDLSNKDNEKLKEELEIKTKELNQLKYQYVPVEREQNSGNLKTQLENKEQELLKIKDNYFQLRNNIRKLKEENETYIQKFKSVSQEFQKDKIKWTKEKSNLFNQIEKLESQLADGESTVEPKKIQPGEETEKLKTDLKLKCEEIEKLQADLKKINLELDALVDHYDILKERYKEKREVVTKLESRIKLLEGEIVTLKKA